MIKKTLGGDRLGSGKRMQVELHNYERSTHNLGNVFRSTATPGTLIPFYKKLATNGDTWTIKLASLVRTAPAIGPLFGSYKLQLDFFQCPIRLYNGILHNNMLKIGMDMNRVKLPKMQIDAPCYNLNMIIPKNYNNSQINSSALLKYLGVSGIGSYIGEENVAIKNRKFNAVPILAYFDIFKNYYANKQEGTAWIMNGKTKINMGGVPTKIQTYNNGLIEYFNIQNLGENEIQIDNTPINANVIKINGQNNPWGDTQVNGLYIAPFDEKEIWIEQDLFIDENETNFIGITYWEQSTDPNQMHTQTRTVWADIKSSEWIISYKYEDGFVKLKLDGATILTTRIDDETECSLQFVATKGALNITGTTDIEPFDLDDIDHMRIEILKQTALGTEYIINDKTDNKGIKPYLIACGNYNPNGMGQIAPMNGLLLKTYQADIFNAWLSKDWIDGINGIKNITAVSTAGGSFTIDALNLANKVYDMLNRIAVSGGSYEDWQEAVWGEDALRRAENPIYCGGMSGHIMFEEVVSTADTQTQAAGDQPLGSLAGKGALHNVKGGDVEIHVKEPSYIIGIMSITPLIDYNQGNDFDMTELDSLNDIHKPALDQIGFQELLLERAAWFGTQTDDNDEWEQFSGGKTPAWIEYMTSFNKTYGDFNGGELEFMVLNRNYQPATSFDATPNNAIIKDWTTYINPTKYNYQFANTDLTAQNFWVQIGIDAIVRRKMSAKVMPNL